MKISKEVKREDWQKVRKSLIGQWKEKPEWCCKQLRNYIGSLTSLPINRTQLITKYIKLRIVMNYLVGTGFRIGKIKHRCIEKLKQEISDSLIIVKEKLQKLNKNNSVD